jgi:plastocyanin
MKHKITVFFAAAAATLSLLLAGTGSAAPKAVVGTVGPGFTIGLKLDGKKVTKLKAGVPYRFVVNDLSSSHNFRLTGPGLSKVVTGIGETGTKSVVLRLKKGAYTFVCDPHSSFMRGSFRAG